jgi:hypothetical protein
MMSTAANYDSRALFRIRVLLWLFVAGLVISGATAIPLETEVGWLTKWFGNAPVIGAWLARVHEALVDTNAKYPFLFYGTDWLAFGHFAIAVAFIGPLRDPVKNIWVVEFGMIACVLIVPYAFIMGALRGIPFWWRLIDCSFGVIGIVPLCLARRQIKSLPPRSSM